MVGRCEWEARIDGLAIPSPCGTVEYYSHAYDAETEPIKGLLKTRN